MRGVRDEDRTTFSEPILVEIGFLDDVVLEIAPAEQDTCRGRREIGVFALEPGARAPPGVGERIGLAARGGLGRVGVAAPPAEQDGDVMPSGADPFLHGLTSCRLMGRAGRSTAVV